jgi:hypothetical protein
MKSGGILAAVCLAGLLIVAGCGEPVKPKKPQEADRYYDAASGFSIKFPKEWEQKVNPEKDIAVMAIAPLEANDALPKSINIAVEKLPHTTSLDLYAKAAAKKFPEVLPGSVVLEQGKTDLDDDKSHFFVYTMSPAPDLKLKVLAYAVVYQKRAYVITCGSLESEFDKHRKKFEEIVKTFRAEPE